MSNNLGLRHRRESSPFYTARKGPVVAGYGVTTGQRRCMLDSGEVEGHRAAPHPRMLGRKIASQEVKTMESCRGVPNLACFAPDCGFWAIPFINRRIVVNPFDAVS